MTEATHDLLVRGSAAARVGEEKEARFFLEWLLTLDADNDERLEAQYWLAKISTNPEEKKRLLEEVLSAQPFHLLARREWMILQGKLSPGEIIDPDNMPAGKIQVSNANPQRFVCPQCGGRMVYAPDGASLTCEYCEVKKRQEQGSPDEEGDFFLSMATLKGHCQPEGQATFTCQGCGAAFILPQTDLSITCPHCKSVYVKIFPDSDDHIGPSAIFPARITLQAAKNIIQQWLIEQNDDRKHLSQELTGIYLPIWWFSIGGNLHYKYLIPQKNKPAKVFTHTRPMMQSDVCVPACKHHEDEVKQIIQAADFKDMLDYTPEYIANWLAETYQITLADASLKARQIGLQREKIAAGMSIPDTAEDISFSSHEMVVESYQLVLYPIWFAEFCYQNEKESFAIDAVYGKVLQRRQDEPTFWERLMKFGRD